MNDIYIYVNVYVCVHLKSGVVSKVSMYPISQV